MIPLERPTAPNNVLPPSRRECAEEFWRAIRSIFDSNDLPRVRRFLEIFAGNSPVTSSDPRQQSAPGAFFPGLKALPWHDAGRLPGTERMKRFCSEIRRDFGNLQRQRAPFLSYEQIRVEEFGNTRSVPLDSNDDVSIFQLHQLDEPRHGQLDCCPGVKHALQGQWFAGCSCFSILPAGNFVGPHSDRLNYILTGHLAIRVSPGSGIRVGGETSWWEEGECLVFDASYVHEVWNDGPGERAVLLYELWHPELSPVEIAAMRILRPRIRNWERKQQEQPRTE